MLLADHHLGVHGEHGPATSARKSRKLSRTPATLKLSGAHNGLELLPAVAQLLQDLAALANVLHDKLRHMPGPAEQPWAWEEVKFRIEIDGQLDVASFQGMIREKDRPRL